MRIIAGEFRGRALTSVGKGDAGAHLRPTTDRVRESLFNVLSHLVDFDGQRVLDLFAGTGALGLEALSRGAAHCDFVDSQRPAAVQLNANKVKLAAAATVHLARAEQFVASRPPASGYQLVFLDPPFGEQLLQGCADQLEASGVLAEPCWIYVEQGSDQQFTAPPSWSLHRQKTTGGVDCRLYRRVVGSDVIA